MRSEPRLCACNCGEWTKGGTWRPGHDHRARTKAATDSGHLRGSVVRKGPRDCDCGCGGKTKGGRYLPGHDTRHVASVGSALTGVPAGLLSAALANLTPQQLAAVARLHSKVRGRALGAETNTLRAPIWQVERKGRALQLALDWETEAPYLGRAFVVHAGRGALTVRDSLLFTHLTTEYVRLGFPPDGHIPFSLSQAAEWLGLQEGGSQRALVRQSLRRMRSVEFESLLRLPGEAEPAWLSWGLLATAYTPGSSGRRGFVTLHEVPAGLVRGGSLTLLDGPTNKALLQADEVAARLWAFLESEKLPWPYALFAGGPGQPDLERNLPALADLLGLTDGHRRRVAARVRRALAVLVQHDARYEGTVLVHSGEGRWRLDARRGSVGVTGGSDGGTQGGRTVVRGGVRRCHAPRGVPSSSPSFLRSPVVTRAQARGGAPATVGDTARALLASKGFDPEKTATEEDTAKRLPFTQTREEQPMSEEELRKAAEAEGGFAAEWARSRAARQAEQPPAASSGSSTEPQDGQGEPGVAPGAAPGGLWGTGVSGEPREQEEP